MPGRVGTILRLQHHPHRSRSPMSPPRMPLRHDAGPLAAGHSHLQRCSQKTHSKQSASKTKCNAAKEAMDDAAKHASGNQRQGVFSSKNAKRPRKPGRFTAEPLRTTMRKPRRWRNTSRPTEAEFFNMLLDRQEETQKHLNELSAQVQARPAPHSNNRAALEERKRDKAHAPPTS